MANMRIVGHGAFLSRDEAEGYREIFMTEFEQDIKDGVLIIVEDQIKHINNHYVSQILIETAQKELELE